MRIRAARTFIVEPNLPGPLEPLRKLSRNLYWTWNTDAAALFERIDRELWRETDHNPVRLLQLVRQERLHELAEDEGFLEHQRRVAAALEAYLGRAPLLEVEGLEPGDVIAYFSLEFALAECLPNYSGGLGVLAGDHLKSASDLGLPLVGVGLFYHQGYFRQEISPDGWQQEVYLDLDPAALPMAHVVDASGRPVEVAVPFDGREVWAQAWRIDVGKTPLYVLTTNIERNPPADREITARLYGGDNEMRIQQEMVLGIGGVRLLQALGIEPAVCHMNEGHSALLGIERIRAAMERFGASFAEARLPVTGATVFTTHTAVAAGIDLFPPDLLRRYLGHYWARLGLDDRAFLDLGRTRPGDDGEPFSMAVLGLNLSGYRNGVSQLHRGVSRRLWESAWPNLPHDSIPIDAITNGVHLPTWVSHEMGELFDRYVGPAWRDDPASANWAAVYDIPDEELWRVHERQRQQLVLRARQQYTEDMLRRGLPANEPGGGPVLDPEVLTIGFARRFAGYKRATLLFRDLERLARILDDFERPVQVLFAGKAHPRDDGAKALIREVVQVSRSPEFRGRLVLLERYDVELGRLLVAGSDAWLNTPLRPLEASGTSGMKACANGVLHLSVLDGWWWEAYRPGTGWAIGRNRVDDDPEAQDAFDAESLYGLLEGEVAPLFYERDGQGIPREWVRRMKETIVTYAAQFSTSRMVSDYARRAYGPAASAWHALRAENLGRARELAAWLERVRAGWDAVKVYAVEDDGSELRPADAPVTVRVQLYPGPLQPEDLRVDIVYGQTDARRELRIEAEAPLQFAGQQEDRLCRYEGSFRPGSGGRVGFAVRVMPQHPHLPGVICTGLAHWA
ncbi:alpha-glucan family phosphorylase [Tepidiforma sp.]|jgi:starch phosphorylase|uniref:alpha-glucan family phosphorylase n=1 Tax=Tepidiforma sp. TaxID=2682230 RepID=UPI00261C4B79|nr:alpha-glucan family phosphorylase [Tepidiforma sp.]MCX7616368.1 alpha-glucan family phosphorylase [Tepidiforma sp.]